MTQLNALIEQHRVAHQRLEAAVGKYQAVEGLISSQSGAGCAK
jgi:hypothetical protein